MLCQVSNWAARDEGDGREPGTQLSEQFHHARQRPGRLRVVDDRRERTVEVQAQRDLVGPLGQPCRVLGDRGVGGHGVRSSEISRS
jgi:hypothetical protein